MVQVTFVLRHDDGEAVAAKPGMTVRVVGSAPELGEWQPQNAVVMSATAAEACMLQVTISMNSDHFPFEYKYVVMNNDDAAWQPVENYKALFGDTKFVDTWDRNDGSRVLEQDAYLVPFAHDIKSRFRKYRAVIADIDQHHGGLDKFSRGYEHMGLVRVEGGISYREWAPDAKVMWLVGDFNGWQQGETPMEKDEYGVFHVFLPDLLKADNKTAYMAIPHKSKVKCMLVTATGETVHRVPAWIKYALPEADTTYTGVFWEPPIEEPAGGGGCKYQWKHERPGWPADKADETSLKIYESHVGMATEEHKVGTYREFADLVLPRIKKLGYNAVQFMAVMEHVYYASFGYHITNFFATASRSGTPDDLKYLVDTAHSMGLIVIMDLVHSHASKNVLDGINQFDGSKHHYFHEGAKGNHDLWDSRLFNYSSPEVLRFLLSNARWFVEEYRFDGFRFDGVTSMLYQHHGNGTGFSGSYTEYFGPSSQVDEEAEVYMMLVNRVLHDVCGPPVLTIAEDVSGMPTLCRPVSEGGLGFDYRLAMAIPDTWIKLLKETADEDWDLTNIVHTLTNRRTTEKSIAYVESHDQALVGDKTVAFRLMDAAMYDHMSIHSPPSAVIDRGIAVHKLLRLLTCTLGGEGYLTFMGNEFGHPEWIDFPREGNNDSYHYCRRQWHLADDKMLKYKFLSQFEQDMMQLETKFGWLQPRHRHADVTWIHNNLKVLVYEKAGLVFIVNLHPSESYTDFRVGVSSAGNYRILLSTDDERLGGQNRVDTSLVAFSQEIPWNDKPASVLVYVPARVAIVLCKEEDEKVAVVEEETEEFEHEPVVAAA